MREEGLGGAADLRGEVAVLSEAAAGTVFALVQMLELGHLHLCRRWNWDIICSRSLFAGVQQCHSCRLCVVIQEAEQRFSVAACSLRVTNEFLERKALENDGKLLVSLVLGSGV